MTSKPTASRRQPSSTNAIPLIRPQCKIHATATVADKAQLTGSNLVEIGENTFLHPYAKIRAEFGNVFIGKNCIVSENAIIGVGEQGESSTADTVIGDGVSIESGAIVEAGKVGEHSTIEVNAKIGRGAVVSKWCKVAPMCEVRKHEVLDDFTVVFGYGQKRVDAVLKEKKEIRDMKIKGREKEIELLKTLIPDASVKWNGGA